MVDLPREYWRAMARQIGDAANGEASGPNYLRQVPTLLARPDVGGPVSRRLLLAEWRERYADRLAEDMMDLARSTAHKTGRRLSVVRDLTDDVREGGAERGDELLVRLGIVERRRGRSHGDEADSGGPSGEPEALEPSADRSADDSPLAGPAEFLAAAWKRARRSVDTSVRLRPLEIQREGFWRAARPAVHFKLVNGYGVTYDIMEGRFHSQVLFVFDRLSVGMGFEHLVPQRRGRQWVTANVQVGGGAVAYLSAERARDRTPRLAAGVMAAF
ncbi:MAG: hypothetical protein HY719_10015 [Planctomycetes bacterium]|nr:hypothetical protein [Planctomycetota bacterium]